MSAFAPATGTASPSLNRSDVDLAGLYRVSIEQADPQDDGATIRRDVAQRLHRSRGLAQDFQEIRILDYQQVPIAATLEIEPARDAAVVLTAVYAALESYLSPAMPFHSLDDMLARGWRVDEIFEGPLLDQGFIDDDELRMLERRSLLRTSDLIRALMAVPGVLTVKKLHFVNPDGTESPDWVYSIDTTSAPRLDRTKSVIRLERRGLEIDDAAMHDRARLPEPFVPLLLRAGASSNRADEADRPLRPPPGRDRNVGFYRSVQEEFPGTYGIGGNGVPRSASPARQAQAKQLKAYLMFFDQVLANEFAQLANLRTLFSFDDDTATSYFSQPVADGGTLALDEVRLPVDDAPSLAEITENPWPSDRPSVSGAHRRNKILDHLLARFGEQLNDHVLRRAEPVANHADADERLAGRKRAFLRDYSRMGRDRGTGFNYLEPAGPHNVSGLELRLRRKLGITLAEEDFSLVEHILLRPLEGDSNQHGVLFRAAQSRDPYSLQITLVFPSWPHRYQDPTFRRFVEQTVQDETPAHLTAYVLWKDEAAMQEFQSAYSVWLTRWRERALAVWGETAL